MGQDEEKRDVVLEDWRIVADPSDHERVALIAGGPLALATLLWDGRMAAERVIGEQRSADSGPKTPCTCGEAGGLAGAHNPGARGCLANTDEEEERLFVAEVRARADKATAGPFDVHRYDNEGGMISYQLQQSSEGASLVLCAFDDEENPRAARDAEFYAHARADVHRLTDLLVSLRANITWLLGERAELWSALRCVSGANLVDTATARMAALDGGRAPCPSAAGDGPSLDDVRRDVSAALASLELLDDEEKVENGGYDEAVEAAAFGTHLRTLARHTTRLLRALNGARPLVIHPLPEAPPTSIFQEVARDISAAQSECLSQTIEPPAVPSPTVVAGTPRAFWTKPMAPPWWTYAALSIPSGPGVSELAFLDVAHTYAAALRAGEHKKPIVFRVDMDGVVVDVEVRVATTGEGGVK